MKSKFVNLVMIFTKRVLPQSVSPNLPSQRTDTSGESEYTYGDMVSTLRQRILIPTAWRLRYTRN
jgi:hypothetical protein